MQSSRVRRAVGSTAAFLTIVLPALAAGAQQFEPWGHAPAVPPVGPPPAYIPSAQHVPPLEPVAVPQPYDAATAHGYPAPAAAPQPAGPPCGCVEQQPYASPCYAEPAPSYCGPMMTCAPPTMWEVRAGALLFFRDDENHQFFSFDSAYESNQLLDYRETHTDLLPGVELGVACFNCCEMTGWEGLYWGLFPEDDTAVAYAGDVTGNLDPILNFDQLDYYGATADNFTDAAAAHRLRRTSEIHNAEFNRLWGVPLGGCGCSPWSVRTLLGFRYFRFEEGLEFAADVNDTMFTGEPDELYYTIDAENNLYGVQIGALGERRTTGRLSLTCGVKAGVFCNSASADSWIGGAAGTATVNNGPNNGREWRVSADKEDVAFLGEVRAGLAYQLGPQWRLLSDYRVVGVSGVALPTNQIYHDLRGLQDVQLLSTNGSLILHGVFVGAERRF